PVEVGVYLAERVGTAAAIELLLLGEAGAADADRLLEMGLANRVVPADELRERTLELAGAIAENTADNDVGPTILEAMKSVRREAISASLADAIDAQEQARHGPQVMTQGRSLYED
ncbi:MAG: enoyl-CoA hydratase/isomerase family protein, partial [Salinirussus sp.]